MRVPELGFVQRLLGRTTMYDSVDVGQIPAKARAVAGYVDGKWPTYGLLVKRFPNAHRLSIAVFPRDDADCLDVEPQDATPEQAPEWWRRQIRRGVHRPVVYASVSAMPLVLAALFKAHIPRSHVRLWTAHYTNRPHLCTKACGFGDLRADATQYTDRALGRNLDASLCSREFWR